MLYRAPSLPRPGWTSGGTGFTAAALTAVLLLSACESHFRGGELVEVNLDDVPPTGLSVEWSVRRDEPPILDTARARGFLVKISRESGLFAHVNEPGFRPDFYIDLIDHSEIRRNGLEVTSAFISLFTLGLLPGYAKDVSRYEIQVRRDETVVGTYAYQDHIDVWWGVWPLFFPGKETEIMLPQSPRWDFYDDMRQNMIRTFLAEFAGDIASGRYAAVYWPRPVATLP